MRTTTRIRSFLAIGIMSGALTAALMPTVVGAAGSGPVNCATRDTGDNGGQQHDKDRGRGAEGKSDQSCAHP
jgi:hypothetical protein